MQYWIGWKTDCAKKFGVSEVTIWRRIKNENKNAKEILQYIRDELKRRKKIEHKKEFEKKQQIKDIKNEINELLNDRN